MSVVVNSQGAVATRRRMRSSIYLVVISSFAAGVAHAGISQVVTSPTSGQIALSGGASLTVAWGVSTTGGTINSAQGIFRTDDGKLLGTIAQPLTKSVGAGMAVFSETIRVPENVSVKAKIMGATDIVYERSFNDGGAAVSGSFPVHIAEGASSGFRIAKVAFKFQDNTPLAASTRGSKLTAQAQLGFSSNYSGIPSRSGSGTTATADAPGAGVATLNMRVNGTWQVAGPNPDINNPQFRAINEVNHYITGTDALMLTSPSLPTDKTGMYLLRINFMTPALEFEEPVVRYYVTE